jgi:hypothetical protein
VSATAIPTNERTSGLGAAAGHATTRSLAGMSRNGTVTRPGGGVCVNGARPTVPSHNTDC